MKRDFIPNLLVNICKTCLRPKRKIQSNLNNKTIVHSLSKSLPSLDNSCITLMRDMHQK